MKTIPLTIMIACLFLVTLPSSQASTIPGDANNDGVINSDDLAPMGDHILGRSTAPGNVDCNLDKSANVGDVVCLVNLLNTTGNTFNIKDFFPLSQNSFWDYVGFNGGSPDDNFRWTVLADAKDVGGGKMAVRLRTDTVEPDDDRNLDEDFWLVETNGDLIFYGIHKGTATSFLPVQDIILTDPLRIGGDGLKIGDVVTDTGAGSAQILVFGFPVTVTATFTATITYTDFLPSMNVPAGRFDNVLRMSVDIVGTASGQSFDLRDNTFFLKEGVGLIAQDQVPDASDAELQGLSGGQVAGVAIVPDGPPPPPIRAWFLN